MGHDFGSFGRRVGIGCKQARGRLRCPTPYKEMDRVELVKLERVAHILKGLSAAEIETVQIIL